MPGLAPAFPFLLNGVLLIDESAGSFYREERKPITFLFIKREKLETTLITLTRWLGLVNKLPRNSLPVDFVSVPAETCMPQPKDWHPMDHLSFGCPLTPVEVSGVGPARFELAKIDLKGRYDTISSRTRHCVLVISEILCSFSSMTICASYITLFNF